MSARSDEMFLDIFTTALEGGIGYWSECSEYHWLNGDDEDYRGFFAVIHDTEDEGKTYRIDRAVIAKGYRLATTEWRDRISWSTGKPPLVITEDTDWDYDSFDADVIVQLGLFENVVYG